MRVLSRSASVPLGLGDARDGTITLTDCQAPFLHVVCETRGPGGAMPARRSSTSGDASRCPVEDDEFRYEYL
jgi:hypothetical protein